MYLLQKKCEKYWPDENNSKKFGEIEISFIKFELYADYKFRTFEVTCNKEKRIIKQYHFVAWPDHGVPIYPQSLATFIKVLLKLPLDQAPVVVHCR